jgi:putative restriction endonuclease
MTDPLGDEGWLDAVRSELERYVAEHDREVVRLGELYTFSEDRLARAFPDNDNVRAKLRQQLQSLRDRDEVEFVDDRGTYRLQLSGVEAARATLRDRLDSEPELTDETDFETHQRRARDRAFADLVTEAYDGRCAVCGRRREAPDGRTEVEAAHVYPKRVGGRDDVRNGLALCRLHHWAFDVHWFAVDDDHRILVTERGEDAPERAGAAEFEALAGEHLHLPDEERLRPHPLYLREHRELYGF